jgi:predicted PurR-regulated permease PerM/beta-phosphoglucomutase-like phosphatase (HAD superfamily)
MTSRRWSNITKIVTTATLAALAIALIITFRAMIGPTIVAFLFAFILSYPVNWIQRQTGWARGMAVGLLYVVLLALISLAPALIIPRAVNWLTALQVTLEGLVVSLQSIHLTPFFAPDGLGLSTETLFQRLGEALKNLLLLSDPLSLFRGVTEGVLTVVYVLVLNFWLLKDSQKFRRLLFDQIPADYQEDLHRLGRELGMVWHAFLRGQLLVAIAMGLIVWVALLIIGMPNAAGLAILAGAVEFMPHIGPSVSGITGTAVALFQGSTWLPINHFAFALLAAIIYFFVAQVEHVYLIPRFVGGRVKLHPAVTFIGIVNGALTFGVLGVLLATPVIGSARVILAYIYSKLLDREPFEPISLAQTPVRIRGLIGGRKIEAVIFELDGTLTTIDWEVTDWFMDRLRWLDWIFPAEERRGIARRFLIQMEGVINFVLGQLRRFEWEKHKRLHQFLPTLDKLRGYAPPLELMPTPGITATLQRLALGYRLALISARDRQSVEQFLTQAGLPTTTFAVILTCEEMRNLLPHSEGLTTIATRLALQPNQILMISDTDVNLRAARAMEMATVGVLNGLGREQDMREADLILPTTAELEEWL